MDKFIEEYLDDILKCVSNDAKQNDDCKIIYEEKNGKAKKLVIKGKYTSLIAVIQGILMEMCNYDLDKCLDSLELMKKSYKMYKAIHE